MASVKELLVNSLNELIKDDLRTFQWYLKNHKLIPKSEMENADVSDTVDKMEECFGPEEAVKITVDILRKMNKNPLAEELENKYNEGSTADSKTDLHDYRKISFKLKNKLQLDYRQILVGDSQTCHQKYPNDIYTDLYVVENETGGTVSEQIELNHNRFSAKDMAIKCNDMFKDHMGRRNRKVLMTGIAGVGKTVSVNKFILDWAEGKENQDILFVFPLPFRRLNMNTQKYSLMELLNKYFFSGPEELSSLPEGDGKVMFIFDGLDEYLFPLNFKQRNRLTDVYKKTTVSKIVTNLIKRRLVSSALIWITSRPAAAGLIPRDYIDQVTELRGFNDEQKEQYFIKNSSPEVAGKIIRHIRNSRSLCIFSHIPVFCWISLTVLQPLLARESNDKTPTTLTEMYTSFLLSQKQQMEKKYLDNPELKPKDRCFDRVILKLGKLAFKQLLKGNLIFYEEDLEECGVDVSEGSVYFGFCTQIFQEEKAVSERKVYSYIHRSVQEFLAALYVFFKHKHSGKQTFLNSWREIMLLKSNNFKNSKKSLFDLHKAAVNKALQSKPGHLDLFLQFLLGLSLESDQSDLKKLLPRLELKTENVKETADYIKQMIENEKCQSELKDDFGEDLSAQNLSSAQWSALKSSEETLERSELQQFSRSDEGQRLAATPNQRRAVVDHEGQIMMTAGLKCSCDLTLDPNTADSQFIHKPHTNDHDTQITGSCNLKSSGLSTDPLLKCQSCVHIAEPDQWVQIEPLLCTDEGASKFRLSTRPGRYECVRTRMRWVCDCDVTLQYHTVDGRFLNTELERLQCNRIAPVMDVTVISGKLEEVHLPHYACLGESEASLRDAVKVLSIEDEGSYVEPVQLTRFHAKIVQPSFSRKTLIINWKKQWDEHCDLLLYMRSKAPLILHVYLFPFDDCAKKKVEKKEESNVLIPHPRPDRPFRMKTPHILDVPGANVHPIEGITLRREMEPNFFKIKTRLENDLQMTLTRGQGKEEVWTATLEKDELDLIHLQRDETRPQRDETHPQRDETHLQRDETRPQRDETWPQRDETRQQRDETRPQRDETRPQRDQTWPQRDETRQQRDQTWPQRDEARPQRDETRPQRDETRQQRDEMRPQRDESRPQRDESRPQRDETHPQRDETRPQRDEARPQRDESRPQRDESRPQRDETHLMSEADKARYFDDHWSDLIQRVTNVQIIADKLLQQKLIHPEKYSEIIVSVTSQDGMRKICGIIHSDAVKAKLISILQEENLFHF
uniref:NLRC3-like protein n=1 Tax=Cyprinus carpio carpio TaxID=630221 RepID=A0A9J7Y6W2_CYPCA